jgi:hypothetical protein
MIRSLESEIDITILHDLITVLEEENAELMELVKCQLRCAILKLSLKKCLIDSLIDRNGGNLFYVFSIFLVCEFFRNKL